MNIPFLVPNLSSNKMKYSPYRGTQRQWERSPFGHCNLLYFLFCIDLIFLGGGGLILYIKLALICRCEYHNKSVDIISSKTTLLVNSSVTLSITFFSISFSLSFTVVLMRVSNSPFVFIHYFCLPKFCTHFKYNDWSIEIEICFLLLCIGCF